MGLFDGVRTSVRKEHLVNRSRDGELAISSITAWTDKQKIEYAFKVYNSDKEKYTQQHKDGALEYLSKMFNLPDRLTKQQKEVQIGKLVTETTDTHTPTYSAPISVSPALSHLGKASPTPDSTTTASSRAEPSEPSGPRDKPEISYQGISELFGSELEPTTPTVEEPVTAIEPKRTTISVFQALTLLAQKYRGKPDHTDKYNDIKSLYLSGVNSDDDNDKLKALLEDEALKNFEVSTDPHVINEDPVRRYFESHLCHETLKDSLDKLDMRKLERHMKSLFNLVQGRVRKQNFYKMFRGENVSRGLGSIGTEYLKGIQALRSSEDTQFKYLKPDKAVGGKSPDEIFADRKEKMAMLAMCTFLPLRLGIDLPLDLYSRDSPYYGAEAR